MDQRLERARETLLQGIDVINQTGFQSPEALCNMEKLMKSYHYLAEVEMLNELGAEEYERAYGRYDRMYRDNRSGRNTGRENNSYGNDGGDTRMWWEEQLHKAPNEAERSRIRRLMSEAGY